MNTNLHRIAFNTGIRIDSFGSPVVDKESMLEDFAKKILSETRNELSAVEALKLTEFVKARYGINL
jgi:hypothetical protein